MTKIIQLYVFYTITLLIWRNYDDFRTINDCNFSVLFTTKNEIIRQSWRQIYRLLMSKLYTFIHLQKQFQTHYEFSWQSLALCSSEKCVEMREKIAWCQLEVPGAYAVLNFSRIDILSCNLDLDWSMKLIYPKNSNIYIAVRGYLS